ncbi:hypothetical protein LCGC14_0872810 [marine sediment metagenome]|uniref:Uncharacterized protein n=1 Tax=marine sediment metagenome TaxID=412755 RepID=A0A0F9PPS2_9ZZZZ
MALHDPIEDALNERKRKARLVEAGGALSPSRVPPPGKPTALPSAASSRARPPGILGTAPPGRGAPSDPLSPYLNLTRQFMFPQRPVRPAAPARPGGDIFPGAGVPDEARRAIMARLMGQLLRAR